MKTVFSISLYQKRLNNRITIKIAYGFVHPRKIIVDLKTEIV